MSLPSQTSKYEGWVKHFVENVNNLSLEYCNIDIDENYDINKFETCLTNVIKSYNRTDFAARYEALYNNFAECSKNDGGKSFCRFLKRFIYALGHVEKSDEHAFVMTKHILNSLHYFELKHISIRVLLGLIEDIILYISYSNLLDLADLINTKISQSKIGSEVPEHFLIGSTFILRRIYMFNEISDKDIDGTPGVEFIQQFFFNLLESTNPSEACDAFRLASCFNVPDMYRLYIENVFVNSFDCFTVSERASFLQKCFNFLQDMNEKDVNMLFEKYFQVWKNLSYNEILDIKSMLVELCEIIYRDEIITLRLLSMLKSTMTSIMNSSFGFTVAIALCSSKLVAKKVVKDIVDIFIRLWKSSFELDNNAWLIHIVGTSPVSTWKEKFSTLFKVIETDEEYKSFFMPGIEDLCFSLLSYKAKESNQEFKRNIFHEDDSIVFLGKWIFLEMMDTDVVVFYKCIEWLFKLIKNSFGDTNVCIFYIDILICVVKRSKEKLSECWKTIANFIENIFKVPDGDLCCTVVRALLPVIMEHVELRKIVLDEVKTCIRQTTTQDKVIPLLLYLLRAVTEQADVVEMNNYSQSFATYASLSAKNGYKKTTDEVIALDIYAIIKKSLLKGATTKSILYKGLVDNCIKNSNIIPHSLHLLLNEMYNVKEISMDDLVTSSKGLVIVNKPLPQLIAAITRIIRLSVVRDIDNKVMESNTFKLEEKVELIINQVKEKTLDDFKISNDSCMSINNIEGAKNVVFANLMFQMYNISLEYMWSFGDIVNNHKSSQSFFTLLKRRVELESILSTVKKTNIKNKNLNLTPYSDKLCSIELDDRILSSMLNTVVVFKEEEGCAAKISIEENRVLLTRFVVQCFREKIKNTDVFNVHGALSMKMLTSVATSLYYIYYMKEVSFFSSISLDDNIRTLALEVFVNIIIYITKKYENASEDALMIIFKEILIFHGNKEEDQIKAISDDKYINVVGNYYCFFMCNDLISLITVENEFMNNPKELLRRGEALFKLFNHIIDILPNSYCSIKKRFLLDTCKATMKVYTKHNIGEVTEIANELWKLVFKLVYTSQIYSNNSIFRMLSTIIDSLTVTFASKENSDEKYEGRTLKSITFDNANIIFNMHIKTIQKMVHNIENSVQIYLHLYPEFTDQFLVLLFSDCDVIVKYVCEIVETSIDYDCNRNIVAEMLTILYKALTSIINQFISKSGQKKEMLEWECLNCLSSLIKGTMYNIFKICKEEFFKEDNIFESGNITNNSMKKLKAEYKKNDMILHNYNLAIKYFEIATFNLNSKVSGNRFNLDDSTTQLIDNETG